MEETTRESSFPSSFPPYPTLAVSLISPSSFTLFPPPSNALRGHRYGGDYVRRLLLEADNPNSFRTHAIFP